GGSDPARARRREGQARGGADPVPAAAQAHQPARRDDVGRRAADAGHRPLPDGGPGADHVRRAFSRPRAAGRAGSPARHSTAERARAYDPAGGAERRRLAQDLAARLRAGERPHRDERQRRRAAARRPRAPSLPGTLTMQFLTDVQNLIGRLKEGDAFRKHVNDRLPLIIAVGAVLLLASASITVGTVLYLGGKSSFMVLLGMIAAPFLLLGSLLVQLYVLFSWLEERALAPVAGRKPR